MTNRRQWLFVAFLVASLAFIGCAAFSKRNELHIEQAEALKAGQTTREIALKNLGSPDMKPQVAQLQGKEVWLYLEGQPKATRLSLIFDKTTGVLEKLNWFVNENEPESDLNQVEGKYSMATFEKKEPAWRTPHAGPDELFYVDDQSGIQIVYGKTSKKVKTIVWSKPSQPTEVVRQ